MQGKRVIHPKVFNVNKFKLSIGANLLKNWKGGISRQTIRHTENNLIYFLLSPFFFKTLSDLAFQKGNLKA